MIRFVAFVVFCVISISCWSQKDVKIGMNASGGSTNINNGVIQIADTIININASSNKPSNDSLEREAWLTFWEDTISFKVLIFPFKQQSEGKTEYAELVNQQLDQLNKSEALGLSIVYLKSYDVDAIHHIDSFEAVGRRIGADFILYGSYNKECNSAVGQVCVNHISFHDQFQNINPAQSEVSIVDFSRGLLIGTVKAVLYKVAAERFLGIDDCKYMYYSQKVLDNDSSMGIGVYIQRLARITRVFETKLCNYSYKDFEGDAWGLKKNWLNSISTPPFYNFLSNYSLGKGYLYFGNYDSAYVYLKRAIPLTPQPILPVYKEFVFCAVKLDSVEQALSVLADLDSTGVMQKEYCVSKYSDYALALIYIKQKRYAEALKHTYPLITSEGYLDVCKIDMYSVSLARAYAALQLGDYAASKAELDFLDYFNSLSEESARLLDSLDNENAKVDSSGYINHIMYGFDMRVNHYLPKGPYDYLGYGQRFRLNYLYYSSLGHLDSALFWCNYYIDSASAFVTKNYSLKKDMWNHFLPEKIIPVSYEDYYNRAVIGYKLNLIDKASKDIDSSIALNPQYQLALDLKKEIALKRTGKKKKKGVEQNFQVVITQLQF